MKKKRRKKIKKIKKRKINNVENDDVLIGKIYQSKINAMEKFNEVYNLNIDTFNNPEYKTWYTRTKKSKKRFKDAANKVVDDVKMKRRRKKRRSWK